MKNAILLGLLLLLPLGCRDASDPPPPSSEVPPPPPPLLLPGGARLDPQGTAVDEGDTIVVALDVHTGEEALGAFSARIQYNARDFTLESVTGADAVLGSPYVEAENNPGHLFLSFTNDPSPDAGLTGERRVAELTFRAVGGAGSALSLSGRLLTLGDTDFPAGDIGEGAFPREMIVTGEVRVAGG